MHVRTEINQLVARRKEVIIGLADGTILRGRLTSVGPDDDAVAFDVTEATGPAKPFVNNGLIVVIDKICWIEPT